MKFITFDPTKLTGEQAQWWKDWQTRADEATLAAIDAWERGEEFKFKEGIWGDLKQWLLANVFHGKCAYCETKAVRFPGHAEHFRPKGRVDVRDPVTGKSAPASVEWPDGKVATHPGYFWLAYHWKNLLPACQDCNSGRGKQNQFPLAPAHQPTLVAKLAAAQATKLAARARASVKWKQRYYLDPDALDELESPQILNPYVEDPRRHLRFGEGGIVAAVDDSVKGNESIRVYQLDDDNLRAERQKQQKAAELKFKAMLGGSIASGVAPAIALEAANGALAGFMSGEEPYSVAALDYMDIVRQKFAAVFSLPGGPTP